MRNTGWVGFGHVYLNRCDKESKEGYMIDIEFYNRLVELDMKLGTSSSEQLIYCLSHTSRWDIIKVNVNWKLISNQQNTMEFQNQQNTIII